MNRPCDTYEGHGVIAAPLACCVIYAVLLVVVA